MPDAQSPARRACRPAVLFGLGLVLAVATGCGGSYRISGRVIEAQYGSVYFVGSSDEQIGERGVAYAEVRILRDPNNPNRRVVASGRSDPRGGLDLPIAEFGAGWMQEQWLVQITKPGYETVEMMITLPPAKEEKVMLVTLVPGSSLPPAAVDELRNQFERFK